MPRRTVNELQALTLARHEVARMFVASVISSEQRARRSRANSRHPRADAIPESGYHPVSN